MACLCADSDDFGKNFLFGKLSCENKKTLATSQALFFFLCKKARKQNVMKDHQHQLKGKPYRQEKSQDAATSMEDAITDTVNTTGVETIMFI